MGYKTLEMRLVVSRFINVAMENRVILVFGGQKPCTKIVENILQSFSHFLKGKYILLKKILTTPNFDNKFILNT